MSVTQMSEVCNTDVTKRSHKRHMLYHRRYKNVTQTSHVSIVYVTKTSHRRHKNVTDGFKLFQTFCRLADQKLIYLPFPLLIKKNVVPRHSPERHSAEKHSS
jgi:hypothetical protein